MRKLLSAVLVIAIAVTGLIYAELQFGVVTSVMKGDMTEQEKQGYLQRLHDGMLRREAEISVEYRGDAAEMQQFATDAVKEVFAMDDPDTSSDFDYMRYVHKLSHINMSGWGGKYTITYQMEYLEEASETKKVDAKVSKVLKKIITKKMSRYEKIKAIHDYIVEHVEYDTTTNKNSPYYAMTHGFSACQGYAALMYKMMTEAGIPCRVVTGTAKGGLHAWNIVKLKGKWYNVDATWDDPVGAFGRESMKYTYFLKSDADMLHHTKDEEFNGLDFNTKYPMAKKSYHK